MTEKFLKPALAVAAMSMALAAPATAQIAKFQMMTPALPGMMKFDPTSSSEGHMAGFIGSTAGMTAEKSASLGQLREADDIVAGTGQETGASEGGGDALLGRVFSADRGNNGDAGETPPPPRPELIAAVEDAGTTTPVVSRPNADRQVIVRTRTKGTRGGSKIKPGSLWSVGEFR